MDNSVAGGDSEAAVLRPPPPSPSELPYALPFDLAEKLTSSTYTAKVVRTLAGRDVSVSTFQRQGFDNPIHVTDVERNGLDLRLPPARGFGGAEIRATVGSRRVVDVWDCGQRKMVTMTLKEYHKYFDSNDRTSILNLLSLEFSNTKVIAY